MTDLTEQIKNVAILANDSFRSGMREGYARGFRDGLRAAQLTIEGNAPVEAFAAVYQPEAAETVADGDGAS